MINNLDVSASNFNITDDLKKYAEKHLGKLDRYLPKASKKNAVMKVVLEEIERDNGNKYEISVAMEITGGKVIAAKDECADPRAGIDIVETKLLSQIHRLKTETEVRNHSRGIRGLFKKN